MRDYAKAANQSLKTLFGDGYLQRFSVRLWDGTQLGARERGAFTLLINDPGALRAALRPPIDLNVGRAFAAGLIDIEGDAEVAVDTLMRRVSQGAGLHLLRLGLLLRQLPKAALPRLREAHLHGKRHSIERDRAAIGFHYDQPVEFYRTFLDSNLVYSCAYFDEGVQTLDDAQIAKIDYSLKKLRLRPGERLLDIGCGWGGLAVRAAKQFGAHVVGVTLSERQVEEAQRRIAAEGLKGQAAVEYRDYRELPNASFDKIVSIGMFEHVGRTNLPAYFSTAHRLLKRGGLFLNHGISHEGPGDGKAVGFMDKFIFPDGELVRVSDALARAEDAGFEVRDVENLREHYHRTIRAWIANLERNRERAVAAAGEQSYRAWRLYLAGSAQGFHAGRMGLFQSLLAKPLADGVSGVPATRRDLYR
ncbi:MAG: class I SAM-dependent methyltransferase [Candidatus Baltobacteraceae bacterium]